MIGAAADGSLDGRTEMKTLAVCILILLAVPAMAWDMTEPINGRYYPWGTKLPLDKALEELGNSRGRVYAERVSWSEIGTTETLYFTGDTKSFQAFLDRYAKLNYPSLTLTLMTEDSEHKPVVKVAKPGSGCDGKPVEYDEIRYDWEFEHYLPGSKGGKEAVYIALWPGKVNLDKTRVPANVEVKKNAGTTKR
jgi:hypothetical protein